MSPARFAAEHQAIPSGGANALLTAEGVARMFSADYTPDTLASMQGPARVSLGIDWGASSDRSAAVALGRIPVPGRRLFAVRAVRRWDAGALLPGVVEEIAASPGHFQAVIAELNGLGAPCAQMLWAALERRPYTAGGGRERQNRLVAVEERGWDPTLAPKPRRQRFAGFVSQQLGVTTTAQSKPPVWSAIKLAVDKGELIAPASEVDLRREIALLEVELTPTGGERIAASVGFDDLADALSLACVPYKRDTGEWACSLADLTDPRRPLPNVALPPGVAASPHVPGPDGLSIPVRPAWQSITGPGLTVPEGLDLAPLDPALRDVRRRVRGALANSENDDRKEVSNARG